LSAYNSIILYFEIRNFLILLVVCLVCFDCSPKSENWSSCEAVEISIFEKLQELSIQAPDNFGGGIVSMFIFQDSLAYVLPIRPKNKIFIFDLNGNKVIEEIELDQNFIDYPSGIQVISNDSIFISEDKIPIIYLISSAGEVLNSYNLYREDLWEMPIEDFSNFALFYGLGRTFVYVPSRNSFFFPLKQVDLWYFIKRKKDFPTFGEYSLDLQNFTGLYGKYPGIYSATENHLLPFYLSHPVMEVVKDRVIFSFRLDPLLYIYDLDGNYLGEKCASMPEFELGKPLEFSMEDYDSEGINSYNVKNSYFGSFFYVKEKDQYVRIFLECVQDAEGNCQSKKVYALIFDRSLDLIAVKLLPSEYDRDFYTFQIGFKSGFLSKSSTKISDDVFSLNEYFELD